MLQFALKGRKINKIPVQWIKKDVTQAVLAECRKGLNLPEDYLSLVTTSVDPDAFKTVESFRRAYWASEMWSKFPFPIPGVDREQVARESFLAAERLCASTNERLCDLWNRADCPEPYRRVLLKARRLLERLFDGFSVDEIARHAQWSGGSTTSLPRSLATPQNKWVFASHLTYGCIPYLDAFTAWSGWLPVQNPKVVPGNVVHFVAKNAKTDRSIAIEPDWNMFFQLGLGSAIKSRLRRWGVLRDIAQEVNQILARKGSQDGFLATVDMKAASDTVALSLVEALLPEQVLQHVLALRSPRGSLDGGKTWFSYEKVSSMGNGCTFELETALFWAISTAVAGHAMVYGDDIIVPSASVTLLFDVLRYVGFEANEKKTHHGNSPFRESCGAHYFNGVDVSPVYVRKPLKGMERLAFHNNLLRVTESQCAIYLRGAVTEAARGVPRLFSGPPSVDGCLHSSREAAAPRWCSEYQCWEGLRLLRRYDLGPSFTLGALRNSLYGRKPVRSRWQKEPGRPYDVVTLWRHDEWGCDHASHQPAVTSAT